MEGTTLAVEVDGTVQASGKNPFQDDYRVVAPAPIARITGLRLEVFPHETHTDGKLSRGPSGEFILTDVKLQVRRRGRSQLRDVDIASAVADVDQKEAKARNYGKIADTLDDDPRNGWTTEPADAKAPHVAVFALKEPLILADDEELIFVMFHRSTTGDGNIGRFRLAVTDQPGPAVRSLDRMPLEELADARLSDAAAIDPQLRKRLLDQFLTDHGPYQAAKALVDAAQKQLSEVKNAARELNVMVLEEKKEPRTTFILERGVWDKHGPEVTRSVPSAILDRPTDELRTRLDLARWIVDRDNPLTARVIVNHLWQLCFGQGLVRTPDDFGLQGNCLPILISWTGWPWN